MIQFSLSVEKHFDFLISFLEQSLVAGVSGESVSRLFFRNLTHSGSAATSPVKHVTRNMTEELF